MADECELSTYDEVIEVIENLRFLVREKRRRDRLSLRAVAEQAGIKGASTVHRFEQGRDASTDVLVALIRWVADQRPASTDGDAHPLRTRPTVEDDDYTEPDEEAGQ